MSPPKAVRELQQSVAKASASKVLQVVKMVDAMLDRGAADDLLIPIRTNQAHLMPPRPLLFSRLLFLPLDPIVIQPARWRPGDVHIPRTAIAPIGLAVKDALGGAHDIEQMIAGHHVGEKDIGSVAGNLLWPLAARIIAEMTTCPGWSAATGLPIEAWLEIQASVSGVLAMAPRMWGKDAPCLASSSTITALIDDAQQRAPHSLDAVIAVLLAPGKQSERILMATSRHSDHLAALSSKTVSRALDELSIAMKTRVAGASLDHAAAEAGRIGTFLRGVELSNTASQARIRSARMEAASECMTRFGHGIARELFAPMRQNQGPQSDETIMAVEGVARSLHDLEVASRNLCPDANYDAALNLAWTALVQPDLALDPMDRARVGEILFGPDRAESLIMARAA